MNNGLSIIHVYDVGYIGKAVFRATVIIQLVLPGIVEYMPPMAVPNTCLDQLFLAGCDSLCVYLLGACMLTIQQEQL